MATMNSESFNARDIRQTVRAEERHRLAVELHDSIGQVLCLARLQLFRIQLHSGNRLMLAGKHGCVRHWIRSSQKLIRLCTRSNKRYLV